MKDPSVRPGANVVSGFIPALKSIRGVKGCCRIPSERNSCTVMERVSIHEVPGVAVQFALQHWRSGPVAHTVAGFAAAEGDAQRGIESDEVIHVRMGDEDVVGPRDAWGQCVIVTKIEQERALRPAHFDNRPGSPKTSFTRMLERKDSWVHRFDRYPSTMRMTPYNTMTSTACDDGDRHVPEGNP